MEFKQGYEYTLTRESVTFTGQLTYLEGKYLKNRTYLVGKFVHPRGESDKKYLLLDDVDTKFWELTETRDLYKWERKNAVKQWPWMDEDQQLCYFMLCDLYRGSHHVFGKITDGCVGGVSFCVYENDLASFDYNFLTRAVVMAHDRCIRFAVSPGSGDMLRLHLSKRVRYNDLADMSTRHPTLEEHIEIIRHGK